MSTYTDAENQILDKLKVAWDANTPAISTTAPVLVYEFLEPSLKPHPRDTGKPWARVAIRHLHASKAGLTGSDGLARYKRGGMIWMQVFVPAKWASAWTMASELAQVGQNAYEGKRTTAGRVVFTSAVIMDKPQDGAWVRKDMQAYFYWFESK